MTLKSLSPLINLVQLRSLCLWNHDEKLSNPMCNTTFYYQDVLNNFPTLQVLDNKWIHGTCNEFFQNSATLETQIETLENKNTNFINKNQHVENTNQLSSSSTTSLNEKVMFLKETRDDYDNVLKLIQETEDSFKK
ncbi:unnamed protein product [Didymodactylos carnosus]|uniref:Uncharacterized protein n=1 Tax=Didymodactylos carnosus TaxID=1234261 RepID=A0A813XUU6_9BILA|nr:unnamed protein product [Didymodactylos carnosus]CAF0875083.1 unnamed protein product [Didymodactylos carnosus]CAF3520511.1 unnamed protein product [Didymodactylos carnosus]CAF3662031.1 unnamed protein product [Didymodactylos carnosus]